MKNCPKCGRDNRDDATMCRECGARLDPVEEKITCPICGTENLSDAKFCDKCGRKFGAAASLKPAPEVATSNSVPMNELTATMKKGFAVCVVLALVIVLVCYSGVLTDYGDRDDGRSDNGKIDKVNAKALDGIYHLSGGIKLDDGTEYWTEAQITFDDGRLVNKNSNTTVKETNEDWGSGVTIKRPTIHINGGEEIVVPDPVPMPGYMSVKESMAAHNPFLQSMKDCNDMYIKLSSGQVQGYGFEDSNGNVYYLLKDGTLAGYMQKYNGYDVLTVFDYRS